MVYAPPLWGLWAWQTFLLTDRSQCQAFLSSIHLRLKTSKTALQTECKVWFTNTGKLYFINVLWFRSFVFLYTFLLNMGSFCYSHSFLLCWLFTEIYKSTILPSKPVLTWEVFAAQETFPSNSFWLSFKKFWNWI